MKKYYRPIVEWGPRPDGALPLADGAGWFERVEVLARDTAPKRVTVDQLPDEVAERLSAPRAGMAGIAFDRPSLMGVLNVTPDSFSDGGQFDNVETATRHAQHMMVDGADMIDIGGESTRPGAADVSVEEELSRTVPVIDAIRGISRTPISIDTRKAAVARAALGAGADLINDVAAFTYDAELAQVAANTGAPVCLMHAQGDPATMQKNPVYEHVLLDVYDFLESRILAAESAGIPRDRIMIDPGIGFGKTLQHNLTLLRGIGVFHGLGCPVLLGVSRKRFIGTIGDAPEAQDRMAGSISVAVSALAQGVQMIRAHDIVETRQAIDLWTAQYIGYGG